MTPEQRRADAVARQAEIVAAARNDGNRALTDAESTEFKSLQAEIDKIDAEARAAQATAAPAEPVPATAPAAAGADDYQRAIQAERARIAGITDLCRSFNLDPSGYISSGATLDTVRTAVLDALQNSRAPLSTGVRVTGSGEDDFRKDASDGLMLRGGLHPEGATAGAHQFAHTSLRDLAVECAEREGVAGARRMGNDELLGNLSRQFFNPTAAFPAILDNTIEKAYIEGHRTAPVTFDRWTRKGTLRDFKPHDNYYLQGPVGEFLPVPEGGELVHDVPSSAKRPTRKLGTYGRQFTFTRQAFINDDVEQFTRIPALYARSARKTINTQCYKILFSTTPIYDGLPLFGNEHKNVLKTGTKPTAGSIQNMITALGTQTDEFGESILVRPAAMILPVGYAFETYGIFNSPTINTTDNTQAANTMFRYRDTIELIEDPTVNLLAGGYGKQCPWFLLANPEDSDFVEVDYLNGQEVPTIRRSEVPGQLGFVWDIYLDWGITVMDFRGAIKNPGVALDSPLGK